VARSRRAALPLGYGHSRGRRNRTSGPRLPEPRQATSTPVHSTGIEPAPPRFQGGATTKSASSTSRAQRGSNPHLPGENRRPGPPGDGRLRSWWVESNHRGPDYETGSRPHEITSTAPTPGVEPGSPRLTAERTTIVLSRKERATTRRRARGWPRRFASRRFTPFLLHASCCQ
jgi:hypothetical protein